ncbi:MAG: hypothetical protein LUE27_02420 [Clostridia bacterium]|nr:hypothetical protein [Clostridia bacterium]
MHVKTFSKKDAGRIISHDERNIGDREHIDREGEVYYLHDTEHGTPSERFERLCDGLKVTGKSKPLASLVCTMPKNCKIPERDFFRAAYAALCKLVPPDQIVMAAVHLDEPKAQPHLHLLWVPITTKQRTTDDKSQPVLYTKADEKKNPKHKAGEQKRQSNGALRWKRVPMVDEEGKPVMVRTACLSNEWSKDDMRDLHPRIERDMCATLGVAHVGLILEDADERKELSKLAPTAYRRVTATIADQDAAIAINAEQIENQREEITEAEQRLELLRQRENETRSAIADLEEQCAEAEAQPLPVTKKEHRAEEAESAGLDERIQQLERDCEPVRSRVGELRSRLADVAGRVADLRARVAELAPRLIGRAVECVSAAEAKFLRTFGLDARFERYDPARNTVHEVATPLRVRQAGAAAAAASIERAKREAGWASQNTPRHDRGASR